MLADLPPEITISILGYLDIPSLACFRCTSSASNDLIKSSSEYLYRQLSYSHSFLDECTVSSAAGVVRSKANVQLTKGYDPEELERAIQAENSQLSKQLPSKSWESFARKRWITNRNWLNRKFKTSFMTFSESIDDIWRFKLDPVGERVVATLKSGDIKAFSKDGEVMFTFNSTSRYPHIELSEGYFMVANEVAGFLVYRRTSILEPPSPLDPQTLLANQSLGGDYSLYSYLDGIPSCQATKARYPHFVACSAVNNKIYLFNYVEGKLMKTLDFPPMDETDRIQYIDFNSVQIFLAIGPTVWNVDIATGQAVDTVQIFGTEWPVDAAGSAGSTITAMHYDLQGNYCIAYTNDLDQSSKLLWTFHNSEGNLVEVYFLLENEIDQICVENGRVVFVTSVAGATSSLWLINLNHHRENLSNWTLDPPRPYILVSPLPINEIPERIEMSNNQIFISCSEDYSPEAPGHGNSLFVASSFEREDLEALESVKVYFRREVPGTNCTQKNFTSKTSIKIKEKQVSWLVRKSEQGASIEGLANLRSGTTSGFYILNFDEE